MASYEIEFRRSAEKDLRKIHSETVPRILEAIAALGSEPRPVGARKLSGVENNYRFRIGNYRVLYSISDRLLVVSIEHVRHRGEAYR